MKGEEMNITQEQLDRWRAFAAQTLADVRQVRMLIARGQTTAADQLLHGLHDSAIIAGLGMDNAGANRPATSPSRPTGADRLEAQWEANE